MTACKTHTNVWLIRGFIHFLAHVDKTLSMHNYSSLVKCLFDLFLGHVARINAIWLITNSVHFDGNRYTIVYKSIVTVRRSIVTVRKITVGVFLPAMQLELNITNAAGKCKVYPGIHQNHH